jgi:hypothetical protein
MLPTHRLLVVKTWSVVRPVRYVLAGCRFVGQCLLLLQHAWMYKKEKLVTRLELNRKAACEAVTLVSNYDITRFQNSCIFVVRNFVVSKQQILLHAGLNGCYLCCMYNVCLSVIWDETWKFVVQKAATFKRSQCEHLVKLLQHLASPTDVTDAAYKEGRSS